MMMGFEPILAIGFAAPMIFAGGAAAMSVPIIIHLLNKRRFKIMFWAAMDFLLAAQRRNARRMQFQRWLMLILRCMALLCLAAAVAQVYSGCQNVPGILGEEKVYVVLLDDSYSMGYADPAAINKNSHLDQAKKLVGDWLATLPSGDRVTVVRTSRGGGALLEKPTPDRNLLRQMIQDMPVSDAGTDLKGAMTKASAIIEEARKTGAVAEVLMVTDLSYSSIAYGRPESTQVKDQLQKASEQLKNLALMRIVDVGSADQANKGITTLKTRRPVVVANSVTRLVIGVTNGTRLEQSNLEVNLLVDGVAAGKFKIAKIAPGEEVTRDAEVILKTKGRHLIEARLDPDLVPADDVRRMIVDAEEQAPLLIVDGDPGDKKLGATYLEAAFGLKDGKGLFEFAPQTITEMDLPTTNLEPFDAIILNDICDLPPKQLSNLKTYVDNGGLLMIYPGPRCTPEGFRKSLGEDGVKLLPATVIQAVKLESAADKVNGGVEFDQDFQHPYLEEFANGKKRGEMVGLEHVHTTQYFKLGVPTDGQTDVILRYASEKHDGDPAVVVRPFGKGRVVLFTSTSGYDWNTFPMLPGYVEFNQELAFHAISRGSDRYTLALNEHMNLPRDAAEPGIWDGPRNSKLTVSAQVDEKDHKSRLTSPALTMAGVYGPAGAATPVVAVNVDDGETDIRHLTVAQFADALKVEPGTILENPTKLDATAMKAQSPGSGQLPRWLLIAALILFGLETMFARLFSSYR